MVEVGIIGVHLMLILTKKEREIVIVSHLTNGIVVRDDCQHHFLSTYLSLFDVYLKLRKRVV